MKKILFLLSILTIVGCKYDNGYDPLKGEWVLNCSVENGVLSGFSGVYSFNNSLFTADIKSCGTSNPKNINVAFGYDYGETVNLYDGVEGKMLHIYIEKDYTVTTLVYEDRTTHKNENRLYWFWGMDNTSIEHSVFGMASNDTESYWGGYLLENLGDGKYAPIKSLEGLDINTDIDDYNDEYKYKGHEEDAKYDLDIPYTYNPSRYLVEKR